MSVTPSTGQILRQTVKWLRAATHQRDGVTLSRVLTGDSLAEAGSGSEHTRAPRRIGPPSLRPRP